MSDKEDIMDAVWRANYRVKNGNIDPGPNKHGELDPGSIILGLVLLVAAIAGRLIT